MAIARAGSADLGVLAGTATPSYTVTAGSTLLVISAASAKQITGITYNGVALTIDSIEDTNDSTWTTLGWLLSPATGANNFAFTVASGSLVAFVADYSGVASADGSFVTNFTTSGATLTTSVALAGSNEWVVCASICGHLANTYSSTTNLTVVQQNQSFLSGVLYDSNTGYGSGTVGFVTTITGSSPRMWCVFQAFAPASSGTAVTADAGLRIEMLAITTRDAAAALEYVTGLRRDTTVPTEATTGQWSTSGLPVETLGARRADAALPAEFLSSAISVASDTGLPIEIVSGQRRDVSVPAESGVRLLRDNPAPAETLISLRRDWLGAVEALAGARRDTGMPLENLGAVVVSSTAAIPLESLGRVLADASLPIEEVLRVTVTADAALPIENVVTAATFIASDAGLAIEVLGSTRSDAGVEIEMTMTPIFDVEVGRYRKSPGRVRLRGKGR